MMSATMPILCSTNTASVGTCDHKKIHGTPEKATARAVPRKWSNRSGKGQGRDGAAVCAEVCRPSCRWAKARRQKIEIGEKVSRRKKGIGADERRQLRRQLQRAELEKEVLRTELRRTEDEKEVVERQRAVLLEKEAGWRSVLVAVEKKRMEEVAEVRRAVGREQWAAEVAEVRRAVGREQKWARRVEVLKEKVLAVEGRLREEERRCKEDAIEGAASGRAKARRRFRPG
jgi:hypothetical protein